MAGFDDVDEADEESGTAGPENGTWGETDHSSEGAGGRWRRMNYAVMEQEEWLPFLAERTGSTAADLAPAPPRYNLSRRPPDCIASRLDDSLHPWLIEYFEIERFLALPHSHFDNPHQ